MHLSFVFFFTNFLNLNYLCSGYFYMPSLYSPICAIFLQQKHHRPHDWYSQISSEKIFFSSPGGTTLLCSVLTWFGMAEFSLWKNTCNSQRIFSTVEVGTAYKFPFLTYCIHLRVIPLKNLEINFQVQSNYFILLIINGIDGKLYDTNVSFHNIHLFSGKSYINMEKSPK